MNKSFYKLNSYGLTDIGLVRSNNEDVFLALQDYSFFSIADGMGGHNAGEVAAHEAIKFLSFSIEELFTSPENTWKIEELSSMTKLFIENTNSWIHYLGRKNKNLNGMGTTLSMLLFYKKSLVFGHVGDSRIYLFREGTLSQLTTDHSLKNALISKGKISKKRSSSFPYKNVLTQAIGTHIDIKPEIQINRVQQGDAYLLCSDGLSDYVSDKEILSHLKNHQDIKSTTHNLVNSAKENGGNDNITVVLVKVQP